MNIYDENMEYIKIEIRVTHRGDNSSSLQYKFCNMSCQNFYSDRYHTCTISILIIPTVHHLTSCEILN